MFSRTLLAFALLAVVCASAAPAQGDAPEGPFKLLVPGEIELADFYPDLIGSTMVRAGDDGAFIVFPQFAKDESGYRTFTFDKPTWTAHKGSPPKGLVPDRWTSPQAYCWLPKLGRVLLLKQEWGHSQSKENPSSWLFNPADGAWEPVAKDLRMSHLSKDFEPAPGRDGMRVPLWGTLCYDATHGEAVSFGGGAVWGRVAEKPSAVAPGDWIYDEQAGRVRRLTADDKGKVAAARRWFPGRVGTWLFSEADKEWRPLPQPMHQQPTGRILPGMAYDPEHKKIVLFGGDDLSGTLGDTWIYDCASRTWSEAKPAVAPPPRAGHAMVYLPQRKAILLAGGYTGGWSGLRDVWTYSVAENKWTCLGSAEGGKKPQTRGLVLPTAANYASGVWAADREAVVLAIYPGSRRNRKVPVYTLSGSDIPAEGVEPFDLPDPWHVHAMGRLLPGEYDKAPNTAADPAEVRKELGALPANTWVTRKPPAPVHEREWGSYIYDIRTHIGYAWGGGHSAYPGAEISEFHLLENRWRDMDTPSKYNPIWMHGMVGGPPGLSFDGWSLLPSHARKSYGVDPVSDTVVTYAGDVYSEKHHLFVSHVGDFPARFGYSTQVAYATAAHGLYGFAVENGNGCLAKIDVAAGKWEVVARGGPKGHTEYDFLVWDSKRDRTLWFDSKGGAVWAFDFKTKQWAEEEPDGPAPSRVLGDGTYIPEMDAVLMVWGKGDETMYFYDCGKRKWFTAAYAGDKAWRGNGTGKDWSPIYDPKLGVVVRFYPAGHKYLGVNVMRLVPDELKPTPFTEPAAKE